MNSTVDKVALYKTLKDKNIEGNPPRYDCFTVSGVPKGKVGRGIRVPWKGIDMALKHVRELLEQGYVVQITPYTREEWNSKEGK